MPSTTATRTTFKEAVMGLSKAAETFSDSVAVLKTLENLRMGNGDACEAKDLILSARLLMQGICSFHGLDSIPERLHTEEEGGSSSFNNASGTNGIVEEEEEEEEEEEGEEEEDDDEFFPDVKFEVYFDEELEEDYNEDEEEEEDYDYQEEEEEDLDFIEEEEEEKVNGIKKEEEKHPRKSIDIEAASEVKEEEDGASKDEDGILKRFQCGDCKKRFVATRELGIHLRRVHKAQKQYYRCEICGDKGTSKWILNSHLRRVHKVEVEDRAKIPIVCVVCNLTVKSTKALGAHYNEKHSEPGSIVCRVCQKSFNTIFSLRNHMTAVHEKSEMRNYTCQLCFKSYTNKFLLDNHIKTAHDKKRDEQCNLCGKMFFKKGDLRNHHAHVHQEKTQICEVCGKGFSTTCALKGHMDVHFNEGLPDAKIIKRVSSSGSYTPPVKVIQNRCGICEKDFDNKDALKHHLKSVHDQDQRHQCHMCEYSFAFEHKLTNHIKAVHENVRDHICPHCGRTFYNKSNMESHVENMHTGKEKVCKYECGICEAKYVASRELKDHYDSEHPGLPRFSCKTCNYTTDIKAVMNKHMRGAHKVEMELRYSCGICEDKFSSSHHMADHYKTVHKGEKRFPCKICWTYQTDAKAMLNRHLRVKHNLLC